MTKAPTLVRYPLSCKETAMRRINAIRLQSVIAISLSVGLLGGCAMGPNFVPPAAPSTVTYGADGLPIETASAKTELGGVQRFLPNGDVPAAWWTLYESAPLNHLIGVAVQSNPSLEAAQASLRAAEENAAAAGGSYFPSLDGSLTSQRTKSRTGSPFSLYNASVGVSYAPDVFGSTSRQVESLEALAEVQRFEVEAAYLTLTSNVVTTAIQEASLRDQITATKEIIAGQKKQLGMMRAQFDAGAISRQTVLAQSSLVSSSEAALPALEQQLASTRHLMSVLMGQFPSQGIAASFDLTSLKLPTDIPVTLPSKLVEQRPDIRAALANLHAANANIGVATAAMFPQITLSGSYGVSAGAIADLFSPGTAVWGLAAGLAQPLFQGGELLHKKRGKEALFDQAAAQYRSTVLSAFKDVADSLKALESDAQSLKAQSEAERAAAESLSLTTQQFNAGAINAIDLLSAQTSYQQAKIALIKAKAARLTDTAALFQALGGGWWNRQNNTATH